MRPSSTIGLLTIAVMAVIVVGAVTTRRTRSAEPVASPYTPYFDLVNTALGSTANGVALWDGAGEGIVFIDLDRLDANCETVATQFVADPTQIRLVTKSLPSLDLLLRIMSKVGTNKLMVFSVSVLLALLSDARFAAQQNDYLLGLPFTNLAASRFFNAAINQYHISPAVLSQVQWLIDTPTRLAEYAVLAQQYAPAGVAPLRISIEIDIGLHRGGAANTTAMLSLLSQIQSQPSLFMWSGFMGYDGHVGNDPTIPIFGPAEFYHDLDVAAASYQAYIDAAKIACPERFDSSAVQGLALAAPMFNGAGSLTISAYRTGLNSTSSPLNDYAIGSGFLKPYDFDFFTLDALQPAMYLAGPILKAMNTEDCVPFVNWEWIEQNYPAEFCHGYFIDGMGLNAIRVEDPLAFHADPFYGSDSGLNLLPTQALFHTNCSYSLNVGDHVFFRPGEGDIVVAFNQIVLVQGATKSVVGTWPSFRGGITTTRR